MNLKRILRIKEIEEKERARKLREIEEEIARLIEEKRRYEEELRACQENITNSAEAMRLIFRQKAFVSKIEEIESRIRELEKVRDDEAENLKELKREEKAVKILKDRVAYEDYANSLKREFLQLGFIHLVKKGMKFLLIFSLVAYSQSAVQEKLKEMEKGNQEKRLREVERVIEEKLRKLIEERKRLEALRKRPLTEEEEKEVKKLIKIVGKTPSDEAGAILNEVRPRIAAEILIRLKERQAGQILAAMDPKKAAVVTEIIMSWRKRSAQKR
ncbi:magnesium transporter MgtE N-terminal domain-containing protein [Hydrogenivirga sp.]